MMGRAYITMWAYIVRCFQKQCHPYANSCLLMFLARGLVKQLLLDSPVFPVNEADKLIHVSGCHFVLT